MECEVNATVPGFLVVLDSYYPGWKAYVDGRESGILRANYAFRAVEVPAGIHTVALSYSPRSFQVGFAVTAIFLLAGIALAITEARS